MTFQTRTLLLLLTISLLPACTIRMINVPGEETGFSNAVSLDVTVEASAALQQYQFRLVPNDSPDANCSANLSSYSAMQPIGTHLVTNFSGQADGPLHLCVRAQGVVYITQGENPPQASTFTTYANATWTEDTVPPEAFTITGPTGTQHQNKPTVTWTQSVGSSSYELDITSDAACQNVFKHYSGLTGTSFQLAEGIPNGFWHVCMKAKDLATNSTPASNNGVLMTVDAPFHYLFATSQGYKASEVGSIALADDACTLHAFVGNLIPDWNGVDVIYKAVLSDASVNAKDRFVLDRSIFNRNNQLVSFGTDLWTNPLLIPINYDENGFLLGSAGVWTGSNADGTFSGNSCSNWSSDGGVGMTGVADQITSQWVTNADTACNVGKRLYCIGPF